MVAALPRPPQMLSGRIGEEGEEEDLDPGRSGEVGWRWQSGRWPGRGDSLLHQSCELKQCLLDLLIFHCPIPGQIVLPLLATEEVTTVILMTLDFIFIFYVQLCSIRWQKSLYNQKSK